MFALKRDPYLSTLFSMKSPPQFTKSYSNQDGIWVDLTAFSAVGTNDYSAVVPT